MGLDENIKKQKTKQTKNPGCFHTDIQNILKRFQPDIVMLSFDRSSQEADLWESSVNLV